MNKPFRITFTGVDDFTDIAAMESLSKKYPIEWGVLIGGPPHKNRYPSLHRINEISEIASNNPDMHCALHLCGIHAANANEGKITPEINITGFKRFQVNSLKYNFENLGKLADDLQKEILFQHREGPFPDEIHPRLYPLHDQSGGKGIVPVSRPTGGSRAVGYAGGLGPHNILAVNESLQADCYWFDMETSLRVDDRFMLSICEDVCQKFWS